MKQVRCGGEQHRCMRGAAIAGVLLFVICAIKPTVLAAQVSASGSHAVAIGQVQGDSTINIGLSPHEAKALTKATGQELIRLLSPIVDRINAQISKVSNDQAVSIGVVQGFLSTVLSKEVPTSDWPKTFAMLAREYITLGERLRAVPVLGDQVRELINNADAARREGYLALADDLLGKAEDLASQHALNRQGEAKVATRQASSVMAARASVAFSRLERIKGAVLLTKAAELRRNDVASETVWWRLEAGDALLETGQTQESLKQYELARNDAEQIGDQRDLSASLNKIGDIQFEQGDSAAALKSYQSSLVICQNLAAADTSSASAQRDLSVSLNKIGDIQFVQGGSAVALRSFQASLAIRQKLAAADPGNARALRDLSISLSKIGAIQATQGDSEEALKSYQASLAIHQRLVAADPGSASAQRDLSISVGKIGDIHATQGDSAAALKSYQASLAIHKELAAVDPSSVSAQRDLSVSLEKIGNIQAAQGDSEEALKSYQASLAIDQRMVAADPGSASAQRDLSVSLEKIGDIQAARGDSAAALKSYQTSLEIRQKLAVADPSSASARIDMVVAYWKLSVALPRTAKGDREAFLKHGLEILQTLEEADRLPVHAKTWPEHLRQAIARGKEH